MNTLITTLLILITSTICYSQDRLDTTWIANNRSYRLILERDENIHDLNTKMDLFCENQHLLQDSIFCKRLYVEFRDMNSDGFNDLLVFQSSGARANETFNLFLFQKHDNGFKKVEGFSEWPNLMSTKEKGILAATILTGTVEYHFFYLKDSGELIDLNISEEDLNLDGQEYKKGLRKAVKLKKRLNPRRATSSLR